jgi:hypothetical protein
MFRAGDVIYTVCMKITREHHEVRLLRMLVREAVRNLIKEESTKPTDSTTPTDKNTAKPGEEKKGALRKQALNKAKNNLSAAGEQAVDMAAKGPGSDADKIVDAASAFSQKMAEKLFSLKPDKIKDMNGSQIKQKMYALGDSLDKSVSDMQKSQVELDKMLSKNAT